MCFPCFLLRCCFAGRSVRRLFDLRCCWRTGCCHMVALEVKKCSSRSMWFFFFFFLFFNSYSHLLNIILSFYRNSPQKHFRIYSGKRMWWMSTYQAELRWLTTVTSNNKKKRFFFISWQRSCENNIHRMSHEMCFCSVLYITAHDHLAGVAWGPWKQTVIVSFLLWPADGTHRKHP